MPPMPGSWCCDASVIASVGFLVAVLWILHGVLGSGLQYTLCSMAVTLIWLRLLAAVVVRTSIKTSIRRAHDSFRDLEGRQLIVVGFSWGGAVVAELLAQGLIGGIDQPLALLIAPTTSLVATVAMEEDAALRIRHPFSGDCVQVVHGTADDLFCPHQERWNETDASLHRLYDNHVFLSQASKRELLQILGGLLRSAST